MAPTVISIYRSANGDRWSLIRHEGSGHAFVRHEPNPSSGGLSADVDVDEFLRINGPGPEYVELRRILGNTPETDH
jgi:hypothetical protein